MVGVRAAGISAHRRKRLAAAVLVLLLWTSLTSYAILGPDPSRRVRYSSYDLPPDAPWADSDTTFFLNPDSSQPLIPTWCP